MAIGFASLASSCSVTASRALAARAVQAQIALPAKSLTASAPQFSDTTASTADTLVIKNIDGRDMILMRAIKADDGQMVANQVLQAAVVTARFRNVAERHGKVEIEFLITVPKELQQSRWQLRYTPVMYIMGDSLILDKVIVTGGEYRKKQLRGYQQYQRFLSRIINDSTAFVDTNELEIFLHRNIPQIYAFRNDTTFVSEEQFNSAFGVSKEDAVRHYTNMLAVRWNEKRKASRDSRYRRYVKVPISGDGVRLDTVIITPTGDYIYDYTQELLTRPRLKKVGVVLGGQVYQQDVKLCEIARSDTLSFYISSVSAFVDDNPRYITRIIQRQVDADASYEIAFKVGKSRLDPNLGDNANQISEIKANLEALLQNETFALDSISIAASASPEGAQKANAALSGRRSDEICAYFNKFTAAKADSLRRDAGVQFDIAGEGALAGAKWKKDVAVIKFKSRHVGENWAGLDALVEADLTLSEEDKHEYRALKVISDIDAREAAMKRKKWYGYVLENLYPSLRSVNFSFHMHRKGMVKDTVHTTMIDSIYMAGIQAIKDRDYDRAIELLRPYNDYNTAVAYCAKDFNHSALSILKRCPASARVNYMLSLIHSRLGNGKQAVQYYITSCGQDQRYIHRGNLDPEINALIKTYNINFDELQQ